MSDAPPKKAAGGCLGAIILGALSIWLFSLVGKHSAPAVDNQAEAMFFLTPCRQIAPDNVALCADHQLDFVTEYQAAKRGGFQSMEHVAGSFAGPNPKQREYPHDVALWVGRPFNPREACAWREAIFLMRKGPFDEAFVMIACASLPLTSWESADTRAKALVREIHPETKVPASFTVSSPRHHPTDQAAEDEARTFFEPCPPKITQWGASCLGRQEEFVDDYIRAKAGDLTAMQAVSKRFWDSQVPAYRPDEFGIQVSNVRMCAWDTVRSRLTSSQVDRNAANHSCGLVPSAGRPAALAMATDLLREIKVSPAPPPARPVAPR